MGREREDTTKRGALAAPQHRARKGKEEVKMGGGIAEGRLKIDRGAARTREDMGGRGRWGGAAYVERCVR